MTKAEFTDLVNDYREQYPNGRFSIACREQNVSSTKGGISTTFWITLQVRTERRGIKEWVTVKNTHLGATRYESNAKKETDKLQSWLDDILTDKPEPEPTTGTLF